MLTLQNVRGDDPAFLEMWKEAWDEVRATNSHVPDTVELPSGNAEIAMVFLADGVPVALNSYIILSDIWAKSMITYVKPEYRRSGVSRESWDLAHQYLKSIGVQILLRPVVAQPQAGKLACEAYGFEVLYESKDPEGNVTGFMMRKAI